MKLPDQIIVWPGEAERHLECNDNQYGLEQKDLVGEEAFYVPASLLDQEKAAHEETKAELDRATTVIENSYCHGQMDKLHELKPMLDERDALRAALEDARDELYTISRAAPIEHDGHKCIQQANAYHAGLAYQKARDALGKGDKL